MKIPLVYMGIGIGILLVIGAFFLFPLHASTTPPISLLLTAQNSHFNQTNPPLLVSVDKLVELTVQNQDYPGVLHNLVISGLGVKTQTFLKPGETETLQFTPKRIGKYIYSCQLHPGMMEGEFVVTAKK